jgi:hypothetical protein
MIHDTPMMGVFRYLVDGRSAAVERSVQACGEPTTSKHTPLNYPKLSLPTQLRAARLGAATYVHMSAEKCHLGLLSYQSKP